MQTMVAEIGSNHNNNLNRCKKLIEEAKLMGFNAVKFQLFKAEKLTSNKKAQKEYKKNELNIEWLPKIKEECINNNLKFGCTPFYLEAVEELKPYIDFYKISSFDILRKDLIKLCLSTSKPVVFSCGLATKEDIENVIELILQYGNNNTDYYFLHCISDYPAKPENSCIRRMVDIAQILLKYKSKKYFSLGYSDHTKDIDVIKEAISNYAQMIELHFDLEDGQGHESKYNHCWNPTDIDNFYECMMKLNKILNGKFELTEEKLKLRANPKTGLRS